jgi:8-oxo-dGTP pyrophosphatase MutT (NUDIX family)
MGATWENRSRMSIRTLATREVYRNRWMRLREDRIERSNGVEGIYSVVDKDDCAVIVPIEGGSVYLVEQFRYTVQKRCMEFPQGGWETPDVDPEELARGELREETGLVAGRVVRLGMNWVAYGFTRQKQHIYLATDLRQESTDRDEEEHDLEVKQVRVAEFEGMLLDGTIQDMSTVAAWGMYRLWKEREEQG